jgi:nucleoside-diphosphate-sugar epimerase
MRIFLAGATGVVGRPLLPALIGAGHEVTAMTRAPAKSDRLREAGAEPVVCDALDREALTRAVAEARPEVVVQHLTDLPPDLNPRKLKEAYVANDRLREQGTANMAEAARAAGARRLVAQTVAFVYAPQGGPVKREDNPLYMDPPPPFDRSAAATVALERAVTRTDGLEGVVLRFGFWYGRGTTFASDGYTAREVGRRRYPIVGNGGGVFSFVHIDDVVAATISALDAPTGTYNLTDDEPSPVREWLPVYADALGAPPPRRIPRWLARLFVGRFPAYMMTELRGASNEKAKRELGWTPRHPTWRRGFREAMG